MSCFFCTNDGGDILYRNELLRIILVDDVDYPGYLRVVLNNHVKELSDLSDSDNVTIYRAVLQCEKLLRKYLRPDKVNLASFGNLTPHVHWHIIPRFIGDRHFPNPTWGEVTNQLYHPAPEISLRANKLRDEFSSQFVME